MHGPWFRPTCFSPLPPRNHCLGKTLFGQTLLGIFFLYLSFHLFYECIIEGVGREVPVRPWRPNDLTLQCVLSLKNSSPPPLRTHNCGTWNRSTRTRCFQCSWYESNPSDGFIPFLQLCEHFLRFPKEEPVRFPYLIFSLKGMSA